MFAIKLIRCTFTWCRDGVLHPCRFAGTNYIFRFHPELILLVGTEEVDRAVCFWGGGAPREYVRTSVCLLNQVTRDRGAAVLWWRRPRDRYWFVADVIYPDILWCMRNIWVLKKKKLNKGIQFDFSFCIRCINKELEKSGVSGHVNLEILEAQPWRNTIPSMITGRENAKLRQASSLMITLVLIQKIVLNNLKEQGQETGLFNKFDKVPDGKTSSMQRAGTNCHHQERDSGLEFWLLITLDFFVCVSEEAQMQNSAKFISNSELTFSAKWLTFW